MTDETLPTWRSALHAAIVEVSPPPAGGIREVEEDRKATNGWYCRECGDVGAGVVINTNVIREPTNDNNAHPTFCHYQAIFEGSLSDLLDAVDTRTLVLEWTRTTI